MPHLTTLAQCLLVAFDDAVTHVGGILFTPPSLFPEDSSLRYQFLFQCFIKPQISDNRPIYVINSMGFVLSLALVLELFSVIASETRILLSAALLEFGYEIYFPRGPRFENC